MDKDQPYCNSCKERHSGDNCPPHEVRTTGIAWFRERITDLESELELAEANTQRFSDSANAAEKQLVNIAAFLGKDACDVKIGEKTITGLVKQEVEQLKEELEAEQLWIKEGKKLHDVQKVKIEQLRAEVEALERERKPHTKLVAELIQLQNELRKLKISEIEELRGRLGHLLAIIHRDGGHHTGEVGEEQSVKDAHTIWADRGVEIGRLRRFLTEHVLELKSLGHGDQYYLRQIGLRAERLLKETK